MGYALLHDELLPEDIFMATGRIDAANGSVGLLDAEERAEYHMINNENRRNEFLNTRLYLKKLSAHAGFKETGFSIKKDELGKPYGLADKQRIFLSIAHSNDLVLCGLSENKDLGVDLEPVGREVHEGLKNRIFHPDEYGSLKSVEPIRVWTIKEALVKLQGGGLRTNLNEMVVTKTGEMEFLGRFNNDKTAIICSFEHSQHWISIAYYQ